MPQDAMQELYQLFHFVNNCELGKGETWDDGFDYSQEKYPKKTADHQTKIVLF